MTIQSPTGNLPNKVHSRTDFPQPRTCLCFNKWNSFFKRSPLPIRGQSKTGSCSSPSL
jgi:hypothetical protein